MRERERRETGGRESRSKIRGRGRRRSREVQGLPPDFPEEVEDGLEVGGEVTGARVAARKDLLQLAQHQPEEDRRGALEEDAEDLRPPKGAESVRRVIYM